MLFLNNLLVMKVKTNYQKLTFHSSRTARDGVHVSRIQKSVAFIFILKVVVSSNAPLDNFTTRSFPGRSKSPRFVRVMVRAARVATHEGRVEINNRAVIPQQLWLSRISVSRLDGLFCFVEILRGIDGNWFKQLMIVRIV